MGFPLVCYSLAVPKPLLAFCKLLGAIRYAVLLMLAVLGLCNLPHDGAAEGPPPEEVKRRLPAVEYAQLIAAPTSSAEGAPPACIVCLDRLEATDQVRRLGNCAHAFHSGCIDRWIDLGARTCPLCRCDLLPRARGGLGRLAGLLTRVR